MSPTTILVIRPGALGDAVLTLPLLEALEGGGARRVVVLGAPASWSFLAPGALEVRDLGSREWLGLFGAGGTLPDGARRIVEGCDGAILCLGAGRDGVEAALRSAGIDRIAGIAVAGMDGLARSAASPAGLSGDFSVDHAAFRLLSALPALGLPMADFEDAALAPKTVDKDPLIRVAPDEASAARIALLPAVKPDEKILVLHSGSGGASKCWPAQRFAALARAAPGLGLRPVVLLGPADAAIVEGVRRALPAGLAMPCVAHRPLREVLALLATARAFVGNDSGITHLAARATATLAIFGPTDPRLWRPLGRKVIVRAAAGGRLADLEVDTVLSDLAALLRL